MEKFIEIRENGYGDTAVDRISLEKMAFDAIMELPKDSWERVLAKYFEKYANLEVAL